MTETEVKPCNWCGKGIRWDNKRPYNPDGTAHHCKKPEQQKGPIQKVPVDIIKPPQVCTSPAASTPNPSNSTGIKEVTLGCTINLDSYENFRIEVTGSSADSCKAYIIDTLKGYGSTSPATKEKIVRYMERVFGVI